jgi:hypothetical protein
MKKTHHSSIEQIRVDSVVSKIFNIKVSELKQYKPYRSITQISEARGVSMFLQHTIYGISFPKIARHFNKKSHATPIAACKTISNLIETDPQLREKVNLCRQVLSNYCVDVSKQRYNLHYLIAAAGIKVLGSTKTIYIPASTYSTLNGILNNRIKRLVHKHNYRIQLTIE